MGDTPLLASGTDLNNINTVGTYRTNSSSAANSCINKPSVTFNDGFVLFVMNSYGSTSAYYQIQLLFSNKRCFIRYNDRTWGSWSEFSADIPTFYKNYSDINSLYSVINGMFGVGELNNVNANDIAKNCIGSISIGNGASALNYPSGYGFIIHLNSNGYFGMVQIFISNVANEIWTRSKENMSTATWRSWSKII